jgi:hypothetical protein
MVQVPRSGATLTDSHRAQIIRFPPTSPPMRKVSRCAAFRAIPNRVFRSLSRSICLDVNQLGGGIAGLCGGLDSLQQKLRSVSVEVENGFSLLKFAKVPVHQPSSFTRTAVVLPAVYPGATRIWVLPFAT